MSHTYSKIIIALIVCIFLIPGYGKVFAADPSQVNQISIDDGTVPDLGLSLNKTTSYILGITQYGAPTVYFYYGTSAGNHMDL